VSISINSCSVFVNEMVTYDQNNYKNSRVSTIFKIKYDLRILLETGMILLIVCGVVLVVSVVGARMYILFKEKNIKKHRFDY